MATIGNYGTGTYAVRTEITGPFGAEESQTNRFDDPDEAAKCFSEWKQDDGPIFGTCPEKFHRTRANRVLREFMDAKPA